MPVRTQKYITREDLRNNPDTIYVFGDNFVGRGYGGQAKSMRGEPNAFGIPTKWSPTEPLTRANIYKYHSTRYAVDLVMQIIISRFYHLALLADRGIDIVLPEDGLGTGLADLEKNFPELDHYIKGAVRKLVEEYGVNVVNVPPPGSE